MYLVPGVSAPGGSDRGGLLRGVSAPRGSDRGMSAPGGCLLPEGGLRQTRPPVNRITDTSKNITLATTSLRPVKMQKTVTIIDISDRSTSGKTRSFHRSHILQMQCDVKLKLAFGVASS